VPAIVALALATTTWIRLHAYELVWCATSEPGQALFAPDSVVVKRRAADLMSPCQEDVVIALE